MDRGLKGDRAAIAVGGFGELLGHGCLFNAGKFDVRRCCIRRSLLRIRRYSWLQRIGVTQRGQIQIRFACSLRLLLETMQHVDRFVELRHIEHPERPGGIANPDKNRCR